MAASLTYGLSDFLGGLSSRTRTLLAVLLVSQTTALVLLAAIVAARGSGPPGAGSLLAAVLAGVSATIGTAALYRGLAVGVMSVVAPVAALAPVVPVLVGVVVGQPPAPGQGVGIVLAVVGVVLVSLAPRPSHGAGAAVGVGVLLGVLAALGFGVSFVATATASRGGVPWALLVAQLAEMTILVGAFVATRPRLRLRAADLPVLMLIGALIVGTDSLYAVATTLGNLGVVAVLSSLYPLVTIGLARVRLHERLTPAQRAGVLSCLVGVVVIAAA